MTRKKEKSGAIYDDTKLFCQRVYPRVLEQLVPIIAAGSLRGVGLEGVANFLGEVLAGVEVLEEAAYGVEVFVCELNPPCLQNV